MTSNGVKMVLPLKLIFPLLPCHTPSDKTIIQDKISKYIYRLHEIAQIINIAAIMMISLLFVMAWVFNHSL